MLVLLSLISAATLASLGFAAGAIWHSQVVFHCPDCHHYRDRWGAELHWYPPESHVKESSCISCQTLNRITARKLETSTCQ